MRSCESASSGGRTATLRSPSASLRWREGKYIQSQAEHHRRLDYKTELLELLKRHKVEYDERYLWK
jgi:hypothetical protein